MLARIFRQRDRVTSRRANVRNFVRRHRAADSRAVDDDADIDRSLGNRAGDGVREIRIIDGVLRVRPEIVNAKSRPAEKFFELFFEFKTAVVAADERLTELSPRRAFRFF